MKAYVVRNKKTGQWWSRNAYWTDKITNRKIWNKESHAKLAKNRTRGLGEIVELEIADDVIASEQRNIKIAVNSKQFFEVMAVDFASAAIKVLRHLKVFGLEYIEECDDNWTGKVSGHEYLGWMKQPEKIE